MSGPYHGEEETLRARLASAEDDVARLMAAERELAHPSIVGRLARLSATTAVSYVCLTAMGFDLVRVPASARAGSSWLPACAVFVVSAVVAAAVRRRVDAEREATS